MSCAASTLREAHIFEGLGLASLLAWDLNLFVEVGLFPPHAHTLRSVACRSYSALGFHVF